MGILCPGVSRRRCVYARVFASDCVCHTTMLSHPVHGSGRIGYRILSVRLWLCLLCVYDDGSFPSTGNKEDDDHPKLFRLCDTRLFERAESCACYVLDGRVDDDSSIDREILGFCRFSPLSAAAATSPQLHFPCECVCVQ